MNQNTEKREKILAFIREHGLKPVKGGVTAKMLCREFDISPQTWARWQREDKAFSDAIADANAEFKTTLGGRLVKSLVAVATGAKTIKTRKRYAPNAEGQPKLIELIRDEIDNPPDVKAIIYLLQNIEPGEWKDTLTADVNFKPISLNVSRETNEALNAITKNNNNAK